MTKYLGMQGDLICYIKDTKEELLAIPLVTFTDIVPTEDEYEVIDGNYVLKQQSIQEDNNLSE